ncbi:hypothetical protein PGB90_007826 [Kerria lacca]
MFTQFSQFKNYVRFLYFFGIVLIAINDIAWAKSGDKKLPDYIHLCKKEDPELNKCLVNLFESLRPKLGQGIPEIELPPLDPLILHEIVIFPGGNGKMKLFAHEVKVTGVKNLKINRVKVNIKKLEVEVSVYFPFLHFEGMYDVNARFLQFVVKGKGPLKGNATEVTGLALLKGKFIQIKDERYVEFYSANVDVNLRSYQIRIEKALPNKEINNELNNLLNDPTVVPVETIKPLMNKLASTMLLDMVNKISKNLSFDKIFN